jgi:hypothetical protein
MLSWKKTKTDRESAESNRRMPGAKMRGDLVDPSKNLGIELPLLRLRAIEEGLA